LRAMKEDAALSHIPVIVISAQYPETTEAASELDIHLKRAVGGLVTDTLNLVQALVAALPPTLQESAPASPPA
jgi:hypothetical protein